MNDFYDVMSKRTDAELIKILNSPSDHYQPEAFEAAKKEFEKRNLNDDQISFAQQEIASEIEFKDQKANEPLNYPWKAAAFMLPGVISLMVAGSLKADGYNAKAKDIFKWTLYGVCFYTALFIIIFLLNIH